MMTFFLFLVVSFFGLKNANEYSESTEKNTLHECVVHGINEVSHKFVRLKVC